MSHKDAPTAEQAADLEAKFYNHCQQAAAKLKSADVILLVTGAGWGADSGLAVYGDIAKVAAYKKMGFEYHDLSQPGMLEKDAALFYGFWGQCMNDYRQTRPHKGYDIIIRWRNDKDQTAAATQIREAILEKYAARQPFDAEGVQERTPYEANANGPAGAFHAFTSNVDGQFYDKLPPQEIHDCHGSIELWQCANRNCESGIWRAPLTTAGTTEAFRFVVDPHTMRAPKTLDVIQSVDGTKEEEENPETVPVIGHTQGQGERTELLQYMPPGLDTKGWLLGPNQNWPRCGHCESPARPAIFMFGDMGWKYDMSQSIRWDIWRETVVELSTDLEVCILEVGCGSKITTTRTTSETLVEDLLAQDNGQATLIRINPDFPLISDLDAATKIPIMSRGLRAITKIDEYYRAL